MKTCSKCNLELPFEQFSKDKSKKDGLRGYCKYCASKREKKYYEENKENIKERAKKYYEDNKDAINEKNKKYRIEHWEKNREREKKYYEENKEVIHKNNKKYRQENKEKVREYFNIYRQKNKENLSEYQRKYRIDHKDNIREYQKKYQEENKDKIKENKKEYHQKNRESINERIKNYVRNRRKVDDGFRLTCLLRNRIYCALQRNNKSASTMELVGCSMEFLKDYLEGTKVEGKDYSDAHVDHIRPCASFDLTDPEQQRECFHYTNLQYLPAKENMSKGAKIGI